MHAELDDWSREHLVAYIRSLESSLQKRPKSRPQPAHRPHPHRAQKPFDFAKHPRRKIALKFLYDGAHYSGLAAQNTPTPLPTVEEVLWGALTFTRLVDPAAGFEGVGWEKCGRTDAGVSSAGQVVSFWIRSALGTDEQAGPSVPEPAPEAPSDEAVDDTEALGGLEGDFGALSTWDEPPSNTNLRPPAAASSTHELNYISVLNNVLPPTIRILAWSPVSPTFSARFACTHRHYKYFFAARGLDLGAMRDGAARLVGEHDFRNLCKLDPAKQLTSFRRRILRADISPAPGFAPSPSSSTTTTSSVDTHGPGQIYVLDLIGTAFLYNQVRHIAAVLLLIGTRLEPPALMSALLNVSPTHPYASFRAGEPPPAVVRTKPLYQMAEARPLVLWDCAYPEGAVRWRVDGQGVDEQGVDGEGARVDGGVDGQGGGADGRSVDGDGAKSRGAGAGASGLFAQQRATYEQSLLHAALSAHFLLATSRYHDPPPQHLPVPPQYLPVPPGGVLEPGAVFGVPVGGGKERRAGRYVPVLERGRMEDVEVLNARWRAKEGKAGRSVGVAEDVSSEVAEETDE